MIADELTWLSQSFETLKDDITDHVSAELAHIHKRLDVAHDKLNTALVAVSHLIRRDANMPDHATILADLKAFDADLDAKVDAAVTEFDSFVSTHTAVKDSLDDIATIVAGLPAKAAKLDAIKEPKDEGSSPVVSSAPSTNVGPTSTTATGSDGSTTTVDHSTGEVSTVSADGTPVATDDTAAQAARDAAAAQGVTIPAA